LILTPLSLFTYWLVYTRVFLAFLENAFTVKWRQESEGFGSYGFRGKIKVLVKAKGKIVASLFVLYLVFALLAWFSPRFSG
jgi:uncharacterized membrane protein